MSRQTIAALLVLSGFSTLLFGQESRGSISGAVTDPQGAVIAGAQVTVSNVETKVDNRTQTNGDGYFETNLLNPGMYSVTATAPGFKKSVRAGIELNVAGRLNIPIQLEVGDATQSVQVTGEAPLLDMLSASGGRVVDTRELRDLPFPSYNPLLLQSVSAGMQYTGSPGYNRWFDHAGTSSYNAMGNIGSNEYMLDGAPITGTGGRVGFVPTSEAVGEFRLETMPLDASYAYTGGAVVNMSTRSGTNTLHGNLYAQHYQTRWNALPHFTRLQLQADEAAGRRNPSDPKTPAGRYNQFGGSIGGPVRIPKVFDGRNKLFFFLTISDLQSSRVEPANFTVPQMAWRATGDFSGIQAVDAVRYTIYDPRSARLENGRVVRTPFPGNKGIPILNPAYQWWLPLYPTPNNVPGIVTPEGINNWYASDRPFIDKGANVTNRFDYNISDRHKVNAKWFWNDRHSDEYDWATSTPRRGLINQTLIRYTKGFSADYVYSMSARHLLNLGFNFARYNEGADPGTKRTQVDTKPSDLGLPTYLDQKAGAYVQAPDFNIAGIASYPGARGGASYPKPDNFSTNAEIKMGMTSLIGRHSLKYGWSERRYWYALSGAGATTGSYTFNNSYVRAQDNTTTASDHGLAWAAFMMGLPSGITIPTNDSSFFSTRYRAFYLQDDIRITTRLRINLGLRYERETGINERFNRGLNGGFDFNYRPAFAAAAEAAYAANPLPELPASQFKVQGGTYYLGAQGQPNTFTDGTHNLLPNFGVVYQLTSKTVIRGGYGWAYDTRRATSAGRPGQNGYSTATNTLVTTDNGLTFCCGGGNLSTGVVLKDPFPLRADGTRFETPLGNSLGPNILQGANFGITPRGINRDWQQRWRFSVQREITSNMVLEVAYTGSTARTPGSFNLSHLPEQFWSKSNTRDNTQLAFLQATFPNPLHVSKLTGLQSSDPALYRFLTTLGARFNGATLQRQQLLRAFPNFTGLSGIPVGADSSDYDNRLKYHDLQIQLEKRYSKGLRTVFAYTRAYGRSSFRANEFDREYSWQENTNTRPHRIAWTAIYDLPFGKRRQWINTSLLRHIVGGWQTGFIYQFQSGTPLGFDNRFFYGDINRIGDLLKHEDAHSKDIHTWFDPNIAWRTGAAAIPAGFSGFEGRTAFQPTPYTVRVFPNQISAVRTDGLFTLDMKVKREFAVTERARLSFSIDLLNVTNHTNFGGPNTDPTSTNFGRVTGQNGAGRLIQVNGRIDF